MQENPTIYKPEATITFQGIPYKILPPIRGTRKAYCRFLEQNAIEFVQRNRVALGGDFITALGLVCKKGGSLSYGWGGEIFSESLSIDECFQELALLLLQQNNPRFTREMLMELWDAPGGKIIDKKSGEEKDATLGDELIQKVIPLLQRPNSNGQAAPKEES